MKSTTKKKTKRYKDKSELGRAKRRVAKLRLRVVGRPNPTEVCAAMLGSKYAPGSAAIAVVSLSQHRVLASAGACGEDAKDAITREQLATLARLVRNNRHFTVMSREAQTAMVFANSKMSPFVRLEPWRLRAIFYMAQEMSAGTGVANRAGLGVDLSALDSEEARGAAPGDDRKLMLGSSTVMVHRIDDGPPFLITGRSRRIDHVATPIFDLVAIACIFDVAVVVRRHGRGRFLGIAHCDVASLATLGVCTAMGRPLPPGV